MTFTGEKLRFLFEAKLIGIKGVILTFIGLNSENVVGENEYLCETTKGEGDLSFKDLLPSDLRE